MNRGSNIPGIVEKRDLLDYSIQDLLDYSIQHVIDLIPVPEPVGYRMSQPKSMRIS